MKQFTGKHSKETLSFHLASNHSNYLNQMFFHFLYSRLISQALTLLIMPMGIMGKSGLEYWPVTARVIYLQALAI